MEIASTSRLHVRSWRDGDENHLMQMSADVGYNCFSPPGAFLLHNEDEARKNLLSRKSKFENSQAGKFPVFLKETGEFVGTCGVDRFEFKENQELELGYRLLLRYWGNGFATESAKGVLQFAFNQLEADKVYAFALPRNKASLETIKRLEFSYVSQFVFFGLDHTLYVTTK
jgi:ribosomal-protein-alanine N-acetyltransferase